MKPERSRLFCPMERNNVEMFYSLVDYRNSYFTSNDPKKIIEFYKGFENRDQLIQWMRERPKGVANIHEVYGDKDIIVVIPTADFNGKYAKNCRDNIFKGIHMVFVESGGREDFYFNFAHNVNIGIRTAMDYDPKWIVVSNDDMIKFSEISALTNEIRELDPQHIDFLIMPPVSTYSSQRVKVFATNNIITFLFLITIVPLKNVLKLYSLLTNIGLGVSPLEVCVYKHYLSFIYKARAKLLSIFISKASKLSTIIQFGAFGIFSFNFLNKLDSLFDETFINSCEDIELSLRMNTLANNFKQISYIILPLVGESIGNGLNRELREICSRMYLAYKIKKCECSL